jgi:hypothetical protein
LLAARRGELDAERDAVEAWRDAWITRFELEAAVGGSLPAADPPATESRTREPSGGNQ